MKNILLILSGVIIGVLLMLYFGERTKNQDISKQSHTLLQQVKYLNKMVTAEAFYNEVYSYNDSDKYLFDILEFDKNVILLVNAKAQISYDLSQMEVSLDSVNKIIKITKIPKEQVEIFPTIQYYDLQQSSLNQFSKDDLNRINREAIAQIESHIDLYQLRSKAKKQLFENLQNLYLLSKVYGWKIEDNHLMRNLKTDLLIYD